MAIGIFQKMRKITSVIIKVTKIEKPVIILAIMSQLFIK